VYFWGRVRNYDSGYDSGDFRWLRAGFGRYGGTEDLSGNTGIDPIYDEPTDGTGRYVIHFPTTQVSNGYPAVTSDANISNDLLNWSTVPIVIVNASDTYLEEVNISVNAHYWGDGNSEGQFGPFWNLYKNTYMPGGSSKYFDDGAGNWRDSDGQIMPKSMDGNAYTGNGYRITGDYTTIGTTFEQSSALIYNRQTVAFCPVDKNNYSFDIVNSSFASNLNSYFGRPDVTSGFINKNGATEPTSPWATYYPYYKVTTGVWTKSHCLINDWTTTKALGKRWCDHLNYQGGAQNEFGYYSLYTPNVTNLADRLFYNVGSDVSFWAPYQIIRGWLVMSLYDNGFTTSGTPTLGTREGRISGKYYCSLGVTGRYY